MKLSLIQMNSTTDRDANVEKACAYIDQVVASESPDLIVVPEFFNILYVFQYWDLEHMVEAERDDGPTMSRVRDKARQHGVHIIATIFEEESAGLYYDTAMIVGPDGEIVGKYRKTHPAAVKSLEKVYFRYGARFPVFRIGEWRVAMNICYDSAFPETARCTTINGAELIVVPFASNRSHCWREQMIIRAFENGVYYAPCNKVGSEGDWDFTGTSMIVDPFGDVVAEAGAETDEIITATLDREAVFKARQTRPHLRDRRPDLYRPICTPSEEIPRVD